MSLTLRMPQREATRRRRPFTSYHLPMLKRTILPLFLLVCTAVHAEVFYLACKTVRSPEFDLGEIYRKRPAPTMEQFVRDMIELGHAGLLATRAESWQVDTSSGRITSPEQAGVTSFSDASITETLITASRHFPKAGYSFQVNRITGKLTYRIVLLDEFSNEWRRAHGGTFPPTLLWEQTCTASSRPRV